MQDEKCKNEFTKKIGRRTYKVRIHFSKNNRESFNDRLMRIVKSEAANFARLE